ncbi:exodeoxyribonuclease VII large subunit [Thiomicrorhabdus lithotrophica]|uniref:Exodeoxyribonuclease 7 large subunit n=1 Tax=Thiomicrorhabdus lithotrophica TaxID=2949997 RepID=A0ABY8CG07_9GAMM|nr:exodeoxyribonuclease VII large subunit [Thiomicrorhabdus lithotrophica]WEJ63742.1 exodeoxyribonuclease VII large subunit [Thiomicrorhabdus lithotrophica]
MTFLEVPFREKDQAKALGARWDAVSKRWYVPEALQNEIDSFQKWLPQSPSLLNNTENSSLSLGLDSVGFVEPSNKEQQKGTKLSVVLNKVQATLRQGFPGGVWIVAEIANINTRRGHIYLELTETSDNGQVVASCRAMIWQSQADRLLQRFATETGSELSIGQKVLILAEVSFHEQYGFSFTIQDLDPSYTLGELEQKLAKIRQNLIKKGLYQLNKNYRLPSDYFRIAVIAPPEAAGLGDFRADADQLQLNKLCEFKYFYSSFQGERVESEMQAAITAVRSLHQTNSFDALVIIRGGGAKLDLNMLNIESLAETLCSIELPILSGIGHERDNTILDEIAHTRFDTPSKVIGFIKNQIIQQAQNAQSNWVNIEQSSRIQVQRLAHKINKLNHEITQNSLSCVYRWQKSVEPINFEIRRLSENKINRVANNIDSLYQTISSEVRRNLNLVESEIGQLKEMVTQEAKRTVATQKQQIIQSIAFILSSGPKSQLNRGFSMVKDVNGKPITTAKQALEHTEIELEFSDGIIQAEVSKNQKIKH